MELVDRYLLRLGLDHRPAPTLASLVELHRRHLDALPYDNLAIMLGRPDPVDATSTLARVAAGGNAGYCFHHNGIFEAVLRTLGYDVERRPGSQLEELGSSGTLDHLVLVVSGLPTADHPDGRWWPDLGYGDAFRDPLPLREGVHREAPYRFRIARLSERGWTFHHDPGGSFRGTVVGPAGVGDGEIAAAHRRLSTPPDGHFTRRLVVQRRDATGAETIRGIRHVRTGAGAFIRDLRDLGEWCDAVGGLGLSLAEATDDEVAGLHRRLRADHDDWQSVAL